MRLLNTADYSFAEFSDSRQTPPYAILSHCWNQDPQNREVTHSDLVYKSYDPQGPGWQKIQRCCSLAHARGLAWTWIDTCCIDKTSSAELSEAINSMYAWYQKAKECYVFLDDIRVEELPRQPSSDINLPWRHGLTIDEEEAVQRFTKSRWFTRGWTLQELLAPTSVLFFNGFNTMIGTRTDLARYIASVTRIQPGFLNQTRELSDATIAQRMCWASSRTTTRIEDLAYCLLGVFDVNMPLLYGEGDKAFLRLQQEIIRVSDDESIFAWGLRSPQRRLSGVFATSPRAFGDCGSIVRMVKTSRKRKRTMETYTSTNRGLAMYHNNVRPGFVGGVLGFRTEQNSYGYVMMLLNCCDASESEEYADGAAHGLDIYLQLQDMGRLSFRIGLLRAKRRWMNRMQSEGGLPQLLYAAPSSTSKFDLTVSDAGPYSDGYAMDEDEEYQQLLIQQEASVPFPAPLLVSFGNIVVGTFLFGTAVLIIAWLPKSVMLISALVVTVWRFTGDGILIWMLLAGLFYAWWDWFQGNAA